MQYGAWILLAVVLVAIGAVHSDDTDYNVVNEDGSFKFSLSNNDIGGHYHSASGTSDQVVRGRYGSRSAATKQLEQITYTAGPRGFRARGANIHRNMDLSQSPRGPQGSADDPLADPLDDPSYGFRFRTSDYQRREDADRNGRVNGLYSYLDDVGERHSVRYAAGAGTGYQVTNAVPDTPSLVKYSAPLYKTNRAARGKVSYERGPGGQYKFIASAPDQRRSEQTGADGITRGSYSYLDDKGVQRTVEYIAGAGIGYKIVQSLTGPGTHLNPRPAIPAFGISSAQSNDVSDAEGAGFKKVGGGGFGGSSSSSGSGKYGGSATGGSGAYGGGSRQKGSGFSGSSESSEGTGFGAGGSQSGGGGGSSSGVNWDKSGSAGRGSSDSNRGSGGGAYGGAGQSSSESNRGGSANNYGGSSESSRGGSSGFGGSAGTQKGSSAGRFGASGAGGSSESYGGFGHGSGGASSSSGSSGSGFSSGERDHLHSAEQSGGSSSGSGNRGSESSGASGSSKWGAPGASSSAGASGSRGGSSAVRGGGGNRTSFVTSNDASLAIDRHRDWSTSGRDSTIVKNVGKWYVGLPPGSAVRAHVQNIDLLPIGGRPPSPSEALRKDVQRSRHFDNYD